MARWPDGRWPLAPLAPKPRSPLAIRAALRLREPPWQPVNVSTCQPPGPTLPQSRNPIRNPRNPATPAMILQNSPTPTSGQVPPREYVSLTYSRGVRESVREREST
eukprot:2912476-Pyramimonas_sp.AAC.2